MLDDDDDDDDKALELHASQAELTCSLCCFRAFIVELIYRTFAPRIIRRQVRWPPFPAFAYSVCSILYSTVHGISIHTPRPQCLPLPPLPKATPNPSSLSLRNQKRSRPRPRRRSRRRLTCPPPSQRGPQSASHPYRKRYLGRQSRKYWTRCAATNPGQAFTLITDHPDAPVLVWPILRVASQDGPSIIDMETFTQILDLDEEGTHDFSKGMAWAYFSQADSTFTEMNEAVSVLLSSISLSPHLPPLNSRFCLPICAGRVLARGFLFGNGGCMPGPSFTLRAMCTT